MSRQQPKIVMWYEDALCDDGCATAAYYEDDIETIAVENYEEVADDVYVDEAMEQARKCFVLERRERGDAIPNITFPFPFSIVY